MSTTTDRDRPGESDADAERGCSESESCSSSSGPPLYGASTAQSFRCPCCLELRKTFDRHHWKYPRDDGVDVGLHLCRDCHTAVHGGQRVSVQRRRSHTSDWRDDALARLIARHRAIWGRSPRDFSFRAWYNIPCDSGRILHAIPRSLDPQIIEAATPDTDHSGVNDLAESGDPTSAPTPMNPDP